MAHFVQFLIPAVILAIASAAGIMRLTRALLLEVLRQDYVRTAWSKGLAERVVVLKHSLKNAIIPVVTVLGLQSPILGGTVIFESSSACPAWDAFSSTPSTQRDYPVIQGVNLLIVSVVVVTNLVVDCSTPCSTRGSGTHERMPRASALDAVPADAPRASEASRPARGARLRSSLCAVLPAQAAGRVRRAAGRRHDRDGGGRGLDRALSLRRDDRGRA